MKKKNVRFACMCVFLHRKIKGKHQITIMKKNTQLTNLTSLSQMKILNMEVPVNIHLRNNA